MSPPQTIDWFRLLWDLIQHGNTLRIISARTGIAEATLRGYLAGSHPPHWAGETMLKVWRESTSADREAAPVVPLTRGTRADLMRDQVKASESAVAFLSQPGLWGHLPPDPPEFPVDGEAWPRRDWGVRFRVGVGIFDGVAKAFVVHTEADERRVGGANTFAGWATEWIEKQSQTEPV